MIKELPVKTKLQKRVLFVAPGILAALAALAESGNGFIDFLMNLLFFGLFFYGTLFLAGTSLVGWTMTFFGLSLGLVAGLLVTGIFPGYPDISTNLAVGVVLGTLGGAGLFRIGQAKAAGRFFSTGFWR